MLIDSTVTLGRNDKALRLDAREERTYVRLWLSLALRAWRSLVLVPADPDGSTATIARSLAEVGKRLSELPVTAIAVSTLEYESALALADLERSPDREVGSPSRRAPLIEVTATPVPKDDAQHGAPLSRAHGGPQLTASPAARVVISIPAVVSEPLGVAVAQHADAVVVCVERGRTRAAHVRLTTELVGRERIAGCFLLE